MNLPRKLRAARLAAASVFFCGLLWLAAGAWPQRAAGDLACLAGVQFVPSVLRALAGGGFVAAGMWCAITLLFGRVYCGTVCPLGFLQDGIWAVRRRFFPKRLPFIRTRLLPRALWLAAVLAAALSGLSIIPGLLDPYSIFSRAVAATLQPALAALSMLPARWAEGVHAFPRWSISTAGWLAVAFLGFVAAAAAWRGRIFCNSLCPVGAFLGLLARSPLLRLRINTDACEKCGGCLRSCPAQCLDLRTGSVDSTRCVLCLECVAACEHNGFRFDRPARLAHPRPDQPPGAETRGRREFLRTFAAGAGLALAAPPARARPPRQENTDDAAPSPILPPGAQNLQDFLRNCTACGLCVSRCPTHALQPSLFELGWLGILRPRLDPAAGYCAADCTLCSNLCPTGALRPLPLPIKQRTQLGVAQFHKSRCVIHKKGTDCGACAEHCPTGALQMVKNRRGIAMPRVNTGLCTGCGACQHVCPAHPIPAILVSGRLTRVLLPPPEPARPLPAKDDAGFPF